jgi:hypothetical protein
MKSLNITAAIALLAVLSIPVQAHEAGRAAHHRKTLVAKVRYGGKPGLGYWRPGPAQGYGFAFSSYKRDPFGADDYFDGDRCHYVHKRDYCDANKIFDGFR